MAPVNIRIYIHTNAVYTRMYMHAYMHTCMHAYMHTYEAVGSRRAAVQAVQIGARGGAVQKGV
jgi:hypothetical protein